jgi:hnRNP-L/PTB/hephaestus splicing factor
MGGSFGVNANGGPGCVLLISGLPPQLTLDDMFTLFGVYGNVMRVKIIYNQKDKGLVQFSGPDQADRALRLLNKAEIFGSVLTLHRSKHSEVSLPPPNSNQDPASITTKDFSDSKLHRLKRPGSKNERHVAAPSATLHASGLPEMCAEEELRAIFQEVPVIDVKFMGPSNKMAFVSFQNIDDAVRALIAYHNHPIRERYLKLTFSHGTKSNPNPHQAV